MPRKIEECDAILMVCPECKGTGQIHYVVHPNDGATNSSAKLGVDQVREIRELFAAGESVVDLAEAYKMSETQIRNIVRRRSWKSVG